ncbi:hypothetical protein FJT64_001067 [Amphibalanus amphitrite]|uniref:Uncharacterized protein n=1 Tax=Amphibalanus amphitrite TaxID=1232801 RepID=A0A6A4VEN8_AMPAM|nr:hypothetical protein FJT64_001067 [Amphibalanus amphitrite]
MCENTTAETVIGRDSGRQTCASLSFNSVTSECELYSSVASYATLQPDSDNEWSYYVMPGRSETGQFCRQDSDCVTSGDFCRGRLCTSLDKVTCRTIADTFGSIRHFAVEPKVYGWVKVNADDGETTTGAMATSDGVIESKAMWIYMLE